MKHEYFVPGRAFGLRPVAPDDAELIVALRSGSDRSRFLNPIQPSIKEQRLWLERYFERSGDYYFVIVRQSDDKPEGLIGLYDVDPSHRRAEWGRWITRPGSLSSVESALLIYEFGLGRIGLEEMYCRTLAANASVLSFHDSCGLTRRSLIKEAFEFNGVKHDAVEHFLTNTGWPAAKALMEPKVNFIAERINR